MGNSLEANEENDDLEFKPLCKSKKHEINPDDLIRKWKPDENWEFDPNFSQIIEGEKCENEGASCNEFSGMMTKCVQKYVTIKLQAISKDRQTDLKDFAVESYCECAYFKKKTDNTVKTKRFVVEIE